MGATEFWNKLDKLLLETNMSLADLARTIGVNKGTIYKQRDREQMPKGEELQAMYDFFGVKLLSTPEYLYEYIPYLERAEEWQIKAVREILKMPVKGDASGSITKVG